MSDGTFMPEGSNQNPSKPPQQTPPPQMPPQTPLGTNQGSEPLKKEGMPYMTLTARGIFRILGWLTAIAGSIAFVITFIGAISGQNIVSAIVPMFLIILAVGVGVFYILIAKGITNKKNWAKTVGIIMGIIMLPGLGIGTVFGILILIGLIGEKANSWFAS